MVLDTKIMALLKSMIVFPLTSGGLGFQLLGFPPGERSFLEEMGPEKRRHKNNTGKELYISTELH